MAELRVPMPKLTMTMEEGELVAWHKSAGDRVRAGEVLCEVLSDKVEIEVEAPADGVVTELLAAAGATVPVGAPIATLTTDADDLIGDLLDTPPPTPPTAPPAPEAPAPATAPTAPPPAAPPTPGGHPALGGPGREPDAQSSGVQGSDAQGSNAQSSGAQGSGAQGSDAQGSDAQSSGAQGSGAGAPRRTGLAVAPAARRRAAELGVDLGTVTGSGPRGLIRVQDVEAAAAPASAGPAAAVPATVRTETVRPTAPSIQPAARSTLSPAEVGPAAVGPAAVTTSAVTTSAVTTSGGGERRAALRGAIARRMTPSAAVPQFTVFAELDLEELAARRGRTAWTALLLAAAARALRAHPQLNATWQDGQVVPGDALRVAVAVDTPNGLLAPVLDAPDRLELPTLDQALRAMVDRAKLGKLTLADQQPGTFTVSNLGPLGVPVFQALLTPPQAAALSVGAITQRPVVREGAVVAVLGCQVGLTVDHRVADGADAARYLATLREQVENPRHLLG